MRYVKDGPFQGHAMTDRSETIGVVLANIAGMYQPTRELTLKAGDIRKLNRAIDALETGPAQGGFFAFENEDFKALKLVAVTMAENSNMARSAPIIEDILDGALTALPSTQEPAAIGRVSQ